MTKQKRFKVGIIGMGRMGRCLVQGLLESGGFTKGDICFSAKHEPSVLRGEKELGVQGFQDNAEVVKSSEAVVLAVKPQTVPEVLEGAGASFTKSQTLISIVASVPISAFEEGVPEGVPVVRTMPNTPVFVRSGITAVCLNESAQELDWERTQAIFRPLGSLVRVDENHMNAVTGLSGCGPALYLCHS